MMMLEMSIETKAKPFHLKDVNVLDGPFKHAMDLNRDYLLQLEPDRLLARFREYAGLEAKATQYEGWEAMSLSGHTLGHYLSACAMLYASLDDYRFKTRIDYIIDELSQCQEAHGDGYVSGIPNAKEVFQQVSEGEIESKGFDLNGLWAPLYTIHKLFAGLRDSLHLVENTKALYIAIKLADWLDSIFSKLDEEQMQEVMECEFGGINEVLVDLYADTGNEKYLNLAQRFWHKQILDPLSEQKDSLPGRHANTQIPKIIGLAREYELTNDMKRKEIAEFFWEQVIDHHSYVTGGHSFEEYFGTPDQLSDRLGPHTTETCNTYNMLKLTKHLFEWNRSTKAADYYERALFNHILASQDPLEGGVTYFLSLDMGGYKDYNHKFDHFTCCVGTGMENHASYGNSIYFHNEDQLYVNQYIPSALNWGDKGIKVIQETKYPEENDIHIRVQCTNPEKFTMNIRYPSWAEQGILIKINDENYESDSTPGSFIEINRVWSNNDKVEIKIPMTLRLERMPDNPKRAAIMYGPLVLAGELGPLGDQEATDFLYTPVFIPEGKSLSGWIQPVQGEINTFRTVQAGYPRDIELYPFYRMHDKMYSVYWDLFTQEEWEKRQKDYLHARKQINILEKATIDYVQPGEMQPERDHRFDGDNTRVGALQSRNSRTAYGGGWFSFDLKVDHQEEMMLVITYAKELQRRETEFDIFINDNHLAVEPIEGFHETSRFYNVNYVIPSKFYEDKNHITVKFQAHPQGRVRRIFGLRVVNKNVYKL